MQKKKIFTIICHTRKVWKYDTEKTVSSQRGFVVKGFCSNGGLL